MKALVHEYGELKLKDMPEPFADHGQVCVSIRTAGLNRRDVSVPGRRGKDENALILGSDGAGTIDSLGEGVTEVNVGDEVIINPSLGWYKNSVAPPETFDILGMPNHGTFTEKIVLPADQVEKKPDHLSWEESGVLALSGLTGYRALFTKGNVQKDDTLFIPGAGSGVATYMIQFANKIGARVIVTSRSEYKRKQAIELGAARALDTNSDWASELKEERIDVVIDSVGAATFNRSMDILKKGGRFVIFGSTTEDTVSLNLRQFFYGQYQLIGSTMGSQEELQDMLKFVNKHHIHPVVDSTFSLKEAENALEYLNSSQQFGKIALDIFK